MFREIRIILFCVLFISCEFTDPNRNYIPLNVDDKFDIMVYNVRASNGYIINDSYSFSGAFFLIHKKNVPKWINQKSRMHKIYTINKYDELYLNIIDIRPPYKIFKKEHSNVILLIKDSDTLKFVMP